MGALLPGLSMCSWSLFLARGFKCEGLICILGECWHARCLRLSAALLQLVSCGILSAEALFPHLISNGCYQERLRPMMSLVIIVHCLSSRCCRLCKASVYNQYIWGWTMLAGTLVYEIAVLEG